METIEVYLIFVQVFVVFKIIESTNLWKFLTDLIKIYVKWILV